MTQYKCHPCMKIFFSEDWPEGLDHCPLCKGEIIPMCENDRICNHAESIHPGVYYCPKCGEPACPVCGGHDVLQLSRVTGYLQDVKGWNAGKRQELKDRTRYNL